MERDKGKKGKLSKKRKKGKKGQKKGKKKKDKDLTPDRTTESLFEEWGKNIFQLKLCSLKVLFREFPIRIGRMDSVLLYSSCLLINYSPELSNISASQAFGY